MADRSSPPITLEALRDRLARLPRAPLANLPTPLEPCPRLSRAIGGPDVYVKRDDLTGLVLGGNKARYLEYLLGDALAQGADCVVAGGGAQSNTGRQIAGACARLGLECHLVLAADGPTELQGNLLLTHLLGARYRVVQGIDRIGSQAIGDEVEAALRREGRRPYRLNLHTGEAMVLAGAGYLGAMVELEEQGATLPVRPGALVITSGAGVTHSAIALAAKALGLPYRVVGISVRARAEEVRRDVASLATRMAARFGIPTSLSPGEILALDDYRGDGYGDITPAGLEAIRLAARTEGLLLDPVYTGKAMAGLIDLARRGELRAAEPVVFLHTGGAPLIFAHHRELASCHTDVGSS